MSGCPFCHASPGTHFVNCTVYMLIQRIHALEFQLKHYQTKGVLDSVPGVPEVTWNLNVLR